MKLFDSMRCVDATALLPLYNTTTVFVEGLPLPVRMQHSASVKCLCVNTHCVTPSVLFCPRCLKLGNGDNVQFLVQH